MLAELPTWKAGSVVRALASQFALKVIASILNFIQLLLTSRELSAYVNSFSSDSNNNSNRDERIQSFGVDESRWRVIRICIR